MDTNKHTHKVAWVRADKKCKLEDQIPGAIAFTGKSELVYNARNADIDNFIDHVVRPDTWVHVHRLELLAPTGQGVHGGRAELLYQIVRKLLKIGAKVTDGETGVTCNGTISVLDMYKTALNRMRDYKGNTEAIGRPVVHEFHYSQGNIDKIKRIWEGAEGPNANRVAMVQESFPSFKLSEWYRIRDRDFKALSKKTSDSEEQHDG